MRRLQPSLAVYARWALLLMIITSCSTSELIRNPMIERWCGQRPCDWEVDGTVERVGTWHPNDYAVALVSDDAQLSQVNGTIDYRSSDCFSFTLIAKIDRGVRVFLELDFLNDGTTEFSQQLPASDWDRLTFKITAPDWYRGVRFILRKDGPGRAILAELAATNDNGECTAPPVELLDRPVGARCLADQQCATGPCENSVCGACGDDGECEEGTVCGRVLGAGAVARACVPEGSTEFGDACEDGRQCASGICNHHACSECEGSVCDDGRACKPAAPAAATDYWPTLCAAGLGTREAGALCTEDQDCLSAHCEGAKLVCPHSCDPGQRDICAFGCMPQITGGQCQ